MPGTNDKARVLIRKATSDGGPAAFQLIGSEPSDPTNTDAVDIMSADVWFFRTNVERAPISRTDN
jgi:hypothetical protein